MFSDTRPPQASSPAPTSADSAGAGGSSSTAPGGQAQTPDQAIPSAPPAGVTWAVFHGAGVPVSATVGPARVVRSVATGYAHSPSGALLAAVNLPVRLQLAPDAEWKEATLAMAVDNPTRAKWLAGRGKYASRDAGPGELAQITGFQVQAYSPDKAEIWITSARTVGQPFASLATLSWQQGDWKLVMNGSFTSSVHAIADLTGFVPWSGVS